ncbi:glycosyltransferase family 2 protein [Microbacterium sp. HMH0099]|uniref:glycosyltransferase family 2 protein n=1 Tax=Microbacterium sp. HMH0099 TaxID=3414026 RepID=UPI003BF70BDC
MRTRTDRLLLAGLLTLWAGLVALAVSVLPPVDLGAPWAGATATLLAGAVIGTVWAMAVRSLVVLAAYPLLRRRQRPVPHRPSDDSVALLYCTADDFDGARLAASLQQTHPVTTYILDDSRRPDSRAAIDAFARRTGVEVVRRADRSGFKAGNLNHFLSLGHAHDWVVVMDSDQELPPTFVRRALDHAADRAASGVRVGVVQGRQTTRRGVTGFADEFGPLLESHVHTTMLVRSAFGSTCFLGRGGLVSTTCLRATGGFPEVVAEDMAFSIEAARHGFDVSYAADLVSVEDFPVDYAAFKTQHEKFSQSNVEMLRRYAGSLLRSPLRAWHKIDLMLEMTTATVGVAVTALLLVFSAATLTASAGASFPAWVGLTLGAGGVLPLVPETLRRLRGRDPVSALLFVVRAMALYSSMLLTTAGAVIGVLGGRRARFIVTPKTRTRSRAATCRTDVVVAAVLLAVTVAGCGSPVPALSVATAAACAVYYSVRSGRWETASPREDLRLAA